MVRQEFPRSFGCLKGYAPEGKQVAMQHLPSKEAYSSVSIGCAKKYTRVRTTASYTGRSINSMINARCARGADTSAMTKEFDGTEERGRAPKHLDGKLV